MSTPAEFLAHLDPEDPRTPSQQISNQIRAAIKLGKLKAGEKLPSQPDLAERYGVARETVKAALRPLYAERLLISRQGSGVFVRAQTELPVGLRPHIEAAFERPHVRIDFAGFSGETLANTLAEVLDKVRAGRLSPESIAVRIMLSDPGVPLALPCRADTAADDPAVRKRADRITRRAVDSITDGIEELADLGLVKTATAEVRAHSASPLFKLYLINNEEAFFGFYPVLEHTVTIDKAPVPIFDPMGKDATLFHFSTGDDADTSNGPQYVTQARTWFDSVWTTITREYPQ
ncbi:winged helix-turn-helix domain-containing protein [Pseudonocardia sp. DR1-2]|uniref:winged helix-turn-helix domain-containing protein n=1 Tax=Pseudonocardia sp. DR1-2 TaxID=2951168 RepID=UPI002043C80C|nr:winged helix-turn-helix domain-containing protein [Pseudonocardia sp. DR1-2]MCM3848597.1 winged helix-turn-helix domain-containing protein [Pseudonocardia sp. DR1-2]